MNIYKFYNGKIESTEVIKETNRFYFLEERKGIYGYELRISKEAADLTPFAAIQRALKIKKSQHKNFEDGIKAVEAEIDTLKKLEKEYISN